MYTRGDKEEQLDTIRYEVDMLDYCLSRWRETRDRGDRGDNNAFLEGFLLHYRNLIEFFGKAKPRANDLHITRPEGWAGKGRDTSKYYRRDLYDKYSDSISKYLAHCTELRADVPLEWRPLEMYRELNPTLRQFETDFTIQRQRLGGVETVPKTGDSDAGHTATIKSYRSL